MKNLLRCFLFLLPLASFSIPAEGMSTAQRIPHAVSAAKPLAVSQRSGKLERQVSKPFKKGFKNQSKLIGRAEVGDSNGRAALLLLLGSLAVAIFLSSMVFLALGMYFAGLFFAILGLFKDNPKVLAGLALGLAMVPLLLVGLVWLSCRNGRCFD